MSRGIPTTYKGVQFRSRAEARWAAFFDEVRWPWLYEPLDLDGYIPDFVLRFPTGEVLVEVKGGALDTDGLLDLESREKLESVLIYRERQIGLVLGAAPMDDCGLPRGSMIGVLVSPTLGFATEGPAGWLRLSEGGHWMAAAARRCGGCGVGMIGVTPCVERFAVTDCMRCGGPSPVGPDGRVNVGSSAAQWARACNATQWRPPRRARSGRRGRR